MPRIITRPPRYVARYHRARWAPGFHHLAAALRFARRRIDSGAEWATVRRIRREGS